MTPLLRAAVRAALAASVAGALAACGESGTELGAPSTLLSLTVAPLELSPPFSPDIHDYTVRCAPGPNSLWVQMKAAPGSLATLQTPGESPTRVALDTVAVNVKEDEALVVHVTGDTPTEPYWVRCLPHDFPDIRFTPHPATGQPTPGYYLLGNVQVAPQEDGFAMVLDGRGTPVWYYRVGPSGAFDVSRRADGSISYIATLGYFGADPSATFVLQSLAPWQSRSVQAVGAPTDEHELRVLPGGNALVLSYPLVSGVDLTGLGTYGAGETVAECAIQEIDPRGALVWEWHSFDHIDPVRESTGPESDTINGQNIVDVFHFNSLDVDARGNLLVSARDMDAVFYVDRATGKIVWKLGGAPYSKDGARLVRVVDDPETSFSRQHDARLQPNGDVSMFDDHTALPGVARGVQYRLDLGSGTARVVWQYRGPVSSEAMGSFRRAADGSSVIAWGLSSDPSRFAGAFTEVDDAGHDLLDVAFPYGDVTYRTVKVPLADFDLDVLRATAGHP